ncbi:hypothetical protein BKA65DRAFT_586338 [Rhexocercosporidium sp. MPI-PUGE-AT-0058]|nr:hypothetical protein BKA65DRAFT_586338 [Rhexocercosporidium sp. MPI-PUGE-AT-0058]
MADDTLTNINHVETTQLLNVTAQPEHNASPTSPEHEISDQAKNPENILPPANPNDTETKEPLEILIDRLGQAQATYVAELTSMENIFSELEEKWPQKSLLKSSAIELKATSINLKKLLMQIKPSNVVGEYEYEIGCGIAGKLRCLILELQVRARLLDAGYLDGTLQQHSEPDPDPATSSGDGPLVLSEVPGKLAIGTGVPLRYGRAYTARMLQLERYAKYLVAFVYHYSISIVVLG